MSKVVFAAAGLTVAACLGWVCGSTGRDKRVGRRDKYNRAGTRYQATASMRLAMISAALALTSSSALAADSMYAQAGGFTWSGLYGGIHFGYADGGSDLSIEGQALPVDPDGFIGGVQIGVNHQMANRFVLGAEADITYNSVSGAAIAGAGTTYLDSEIEWSGSARLRAGYAYGRTLPYLTAGVAAAKYTIEASSAGIIATLHDETYIGWTAGAGVEHAFTDR